MSYSLAVIVGPTLGPLVGSALIESYLGWRWTQYVSPLEVDYDPFNLRGLI